MLLSYVLPNQNLRFRSTFRLRHRSSFRSELSSSQNLQLSNLPTFKHALNRHCDEKPLIATPLVSYDYKCPLPQPLSLHILTNAPGVWGSSLPFLNYYLNSFCSQHAFPWKSRFVNPLFSIRCALFQVPYPPLHATLLSRANRRDTKTAGCVPTLPNSDLCPLSTTPSPEVPLRA